MTENNSTAVVADGHSSDGSGTPFDGIRRVDDYGQEYWSARDLQPIMGYDKWENFLRVIERAIRSAENTGTYSDQSFSRTQETVRQGGGPAKIDYRLSRNAAYLVAMNGEPNKPAVAAAQAYFAMQTRKAEIATSRPMSELEMAKQYVAALEREEQLTKELEVAAPKAGKWERFLATDGLIGMTETADLFKTDVKTLTNWLVEINLFRRQTSRAGARNLPRKPHQDADLFDVKMETKNGFKFPVAYVTSKGLDLIDDLWRQR
ncbi:phage antirepressor KilAC domain-containing protein [Streptomyces sp. NPDC005531]|uniref:phage antirepressor KilAC domain-containing protein n=1 Tax=Streptomyces sp. NPDC005531 TaxID=3364722 RepID=UPI00368F2973